MGDVLEFKREDREDAELDGYRLLHEVEWVTLLEIMINDLDDDELVPVSFLPTTDETDEFAGYILYLMDFENPDMGLQFVAHDVDGLDYFLLFEGLDMIGDWLAERVDVDWLSLRGQI